MTEDIPKWAAMGGEASERTPKFVQDQASRLLQIRALLETALQQKQAEVQVLQEKLLRLKHGGGH